MKAQLCFSLKKPSLVYLSLYLQIKFSINCRMHWKPHNENIMGKASGEEKQANIELKTKNGSVKAHKVVLAEASPFFKALFSSNFKVIVYCKLES